MSKSFLRALSALFLVAGSVVITGCEAEKTTTPAAGTTPVAAPSAPGKEASTTPPVKAPGK